MPFVIYLGFFSTPSFPLQLFTLIFYPIFFPHLLFSASLSLYLPPSPLLLTEQCLVPLIPLEAPLGNELWNDKVLL